MLYLIGIGLKPKHLTLEALEALKSCDAVYLESYTSAYSEGEVKDLCQLIGKRVFMLDRKQVEEEAEKFISAAKKNDIAFLVYGNVFSATTHVQVLLDAKKIGVKTKALPGVSIFSFLGRTGLQEYKFGKTVSIPLWEKNFKPDSFYFAIKENFERDLHTLCLLDIKAEKEKFMSIAEALQELEKIEAKQKGKGFLKEAVLVGLAGAGGEKEIIFSSRLKEVKNFPFEIFPQSLIVCGKLNEKEKEALKSFKASK